MKQVQEPMVHVVIDGQVRHVRQSCAELEQVIARGVELQRQIDDLTAQRDAKAPDLQRLIAGHQAELERLTKELATERVPFEGLIANKTADLEQCKSQIFTLARPLMGEQRSFRYSAIAGPVDIERTPQMAVDKTKLSVLRKLLGETFPHYFEVDERVKPLRRAWELLQTLSGRKLNTLRQAITTSDSGRVRFVSAGK